MDCGQSLFICCKKGKTGAGKRPVSYTHLVTQPAPYKENVFMNNEYIASVNSGFFYLLVAGVLLFITIMCFVYLDVYKRQAEANKGEDYSRLRRCVAISILD